MTTITAYKKIDLLSDNDPEGYRPGSTSISVTSTTLTATDGNLRMVIGGDYDMVGSSQISGGTIKNVTMYVAGSKYVTITGLHVDVIDLVYADDPVHFLMRETLGGADSITGSPYADVLDGLRGQDTLKGMGGNDRLDGGIGLDKMYGGAGKDVFDFDRTSESGPYSGSRDLIGDFVRGEDKIDLSGIDANTKLGGNNAFTKMIGANAVFTAPGQLKLAGGVLYANVDGDITPEFSVQLTGISKLALSDFVL